MNRYLSYKPSGVKWLGEIPSHWEVKPIKRIVDTYPGATPNTSNESNWDGNIPWITPADFKTDSKYVKSGARSITQTGLNSCSAKLVPAGSIVFSKRAPIGQLSITKQPLSTNQGCISCVPHAGINTDFVFYLLSIYKNTFESFSGGTTFKEISLQTFNDFRIAIPSFYEQSAIAAYLDTATAKIDAAIAQQQKMIDLLNERKQIIINRAVTKGLNPNAKMKDSGVEWIGEINESWALHKLKFLLKSNLMYGANESAESDETSYPRYIRITDIDEEGQLRPDTFKSLSPDKAAPYLLEKGDVLFARSGATAGKTYLFDEDIKACFAGYLIKASLGQKIFPKYLCYFTKSGVYDNWKRSIFIQATIPNIGAEKYANLLIPLPTIEEQKRIIGFLDVETDKLNNVINSCKSQISLLQERKQIIINEVVTGKVRVV